MYKNLFFLTLFVLSIHALGYAETLTYQLDTSQSEILFKVDSTLHEIHGHAPDFSSEVIFDASKNEVLLPMTMDIAVASLDTENKKRDQAMLKMLEVKDYPAMKWKAESVVCEPLDEEKTTMCQTKGQLKIRDIEKEISFPIRLKFLSTGAEAEGEWSFERKDFNLETPSVLGLIRVAQPIEIKFKTKWLLK